MNKILLYLISVLLMSFAVISCKTKQKAIIAPPTTVVALPVKDSIREKDPDFLFQKIKQNEFQFQWLKLKFDAEIITDDENQSFSGQLRMRKDSIIWLSLSAFGLEGVRLVMDSDSVRMINRLESTYFIGDFKLISRVINASIDFDILQAFITGNDFKYYEKNQFKATTDNKMYKLSTVNRRKLKKNMPDPNTPPFTEDIWIDPETYKIKNIKINLFKENRKFEVNYLDFKKLGNQLIPSKLEVYIKMKDPVDPVKEKKIKINLNYNSFTVDEPLEFPFNIPKKYEQIYQDQ